MKRYTSPHTRSTYLACVRRFALYFHRSPEDLGDPQIREYLHYLIKERNVSQGAITQAYGALKFFYETTLKRDWEGFRISKGKMGKRLPVVLSQQEVEALFGTIKNLKHRAILMMIYSAGLRIRSIQPCNIAIYEIVSNSVFIVFANFKSVPAFTCRRFAFELALD